MQVKHVTKYMHSNYSDSKSKQKISGNNCCKLWKSCSTNGRIIVSEQNKIKFISCFQKSWLCKIENVISSGDKSVEVTSLSQV